MFKTVVKNSTKGAIYVAYVVGVGVACANMAEAVDFSEDADRKTLAILAAGGAAVGFVSTVAFGFTLEKVDSIFDGN